jgi:hypothetical protein
MITGSGNTAFGDPRLEYIKADAALNWRPTSDMSGYVSMKDFHRIYQDRKWLLEHVASLEAALQRVTDLEPRVARLERQANPAPPPISIPE